jgi:branched-chain amino acid transport system permease protein
MLENEQGHCCVNPTIAAILVQDGITTGAIYALLALAIVMVFRVTRIILVLQGEFVSYGALTLANFQSGTVPQLTWLLVGLGLICFAAELIQYRYRLSIRRVARSAAVNIALPILVCIAVYGLIPKSPPFWIQAGLVFFLVVPLGPMIYRLFFQPIQNSSVLVLLMVAVAIHFALLGMGLYFFGAEGSRTPSLIEANFNVGGLHIGGQSIAVIAAFVFLIIALYLFFDRTDWGRALRATAVSRVGARLVGISPSSSGTLVFGLAAGIGVMSGMLIAPLATVYYDTGFLVGLKGFVGAIIGGMGAYPPAAIGALLVGVLESFAASYASAFKEVIVFSLLIPVLLWRSLTTGHIPEDEEE